MILQQILIVIFCVCVIDLSGIITSLKKGIAKYLKVPDYQKINLPLISCSLCTSFHIQWIYLLICCKFTIMYLAISILLSIFTPQIKDLIMLFQDLITKLINKIYEYIDD